MDIPPGFYTITTGCRLSPEQAADRVIPDGLPWTLMETHRHGRLVTYLYLIGRHEEAA